MQHLLFGFLSAVIGLNLLAVSAAQEHGSVPSFDHFNIDYVLAEETAPAPGFAIPFSNQIFTSQAPTLIPSPIVTHDELPANDKSEAYNVKSEKVMGLVSKTALEHSNALIPCTDPDARCSPTETPTLTPVPTATTTPSPTPTEIFATVEPTTTIHPGPTIHIPPCERYLPANDFPVKPLLPCLEY